MGLGFKNYRGGDGWSVTLQENKLKIRSHQPGRDGRSCRAYRADDRAVHGIFRKLAKQTVPCSFLGSRLLFTQAVVIPEVRTGVQNTSSKIAGLGTGRSGSAPCSVRSQHKVALAAESPVADFYAHLQSVKHVYISASPCARLTLSKHGFVLPFVVVS